MTPHELNIRIDQLNTIANELRGLGDDEISHYCEDISYQTWMISHLIEDEDYEGNRLDRIEGQLGVITSHLEALTAKYKIKAS